MEKTNSKWTVKKLVANLDRIEYPEFQREPTVWDLDKKQKLIDSILRNFDIATIYFHKRKDGFFECIDGRQRINAITSFLGLNELAADVKDFSRYHNGFKFVSSDELLGSDSLAQFSNKTFAQFKKFEIEDYILNYEFNVLEVTGIEEVEYEQIMNLMFVRLQLGMPLNAGERLNAFRGDMRDFIFPSQRGHLSSHKYFEFLRIPDRRFARELTASQIALNFFGLETTGSFQRARFEDLQQFFSQHNKFNDTDRAVSNALTDMTEVAYDSVKNARGLNLKNRAMGVTTFFFIYDLVRCKKQKQVPAFVAFLELFLARLKEQVEKGIDIERQYRDLLKFQTYISQAAVEKYAIENRQSLLREYFEYYKKHGKIKGDR